MRYLAFDVETPNFRNDRISAIGLALIENGSICDRFYTLVDPETYFDPFNVELTGITPEAVHNAPDFRDLWAQIGNAVTAEDTVLIAHNAPFDMRVLSCCIRDYGMACPDLLPYACTCNMARRFYPAMPDHKLNTMCTLFGIPLDHHQADSDACACAQLLIRYIENGNEISRFHRVYDVQHLRTCKGKPQP